VRDGELAIGVAQRIRHGIVAACLALPACCVNETIEEAYSPRGRYMARIVWDNCGALTPYEPTLQVVDREAVWPWRFKKTWYLGTKAYKRTLRWIGPHALAVEYPKWAPPVDDDFQHAEWGDLQVSTLEANYPWPFP